ncbi:MAG: acetate--CoA ligase family protein [Firmicutes bacterium]|nr:acetate--CoA ligase family protein [Bacillota bacterium]
MAELTKMIRPGSVAVVGASAVEGKIGNTILKNIISSGFTGVIYPINPKEKTVMGKTAYSSVSEIGEPVDVAVVAVPAARVPDVAEDCGKAGVKNLVVISAGFKETGPDGWELEKRLLGSCRRYGMRMLGPNVVGLIDTHTPINASFAVTFPQQGEIAFFSQSGAMLVAILDWSAGAGLGFSRVVSLGNKADLSEVDFIEGAAADPNTKVILCYIEDIVDGRRFLELVTKAARKKPIIIFKSGISQAGAQAASSHTGALAGNDLAYEVAFNQCGVIRARSMTQLFDLAVAFAKAPAPKGDRVAIVTNSGGPGIIATDNVENLGLQMARFTKETIADLRANLPAEAGLYNPVDVLGDAKSDRYKLALQKVLADPNVDSAVVLLCPTGVTEPLATAEAILTVHKSFPEKPLFAAYMGGESVAEGADMLARGGVPCYTFPEPAIESIKGLVRYNKVLSAPADKDSAALKDIDRNGVKAIFYDVIRDQRLVLLGGEAAAVAKCYGIPAAPIIMAASPREAVAAAEQVGYPVVMKVASPKIMHKTDVGGVKVGLKNAAEVSEAFDEIMDNVHSYMPQAVVYGVEVQKMMPKGDELIVGMTRDVQFGPLIAFGLGGIYVNLLKDVKFRLARGLSSREIELMLRETKAYTLLRGYRGEKPRDIKALVDVIKRVAALVTDFPEISELDINPVFAYEDGMGLAALDIKITIS